MFCPPMADSMTSSTSPIMQSVPRDGVAIDADVGEIPLRDALGVHAARAGDVLQRALDVAANPLNLVQIRSQDLDADRRLDACEQHVEPIANRLRPDVREPRELQLRVHLRLQLLDRHARPPLLARLQRDVVFTMPIGVLSVDVVPRPTVPNTVSTSGKSNT